MRRYGATLAPLTLRCRPIAESTSAAEGRIRREDRLARPASIANPSQFALAIFPHFYGQASPLPNLDSSAADNSNSRIMADAIGTRFTTAGL